MRALEVTPELADAIDWGRSLPWYFSQRSRDAINGSRNSGMQAPLFLDHGLALRAKMLKALRLSLHRKQNANLAGWIAQFGWMGRAD